MAYQHPGAAIESVWDYPRPPRLEPTPRRVRILETSHPPVYYLPRTQVDMRLFRRSEARSTFCEFKGFATYWGLELCEPNYPPVHIPDVAWSYEEPTAAFAALRGHLAFYANRLGDHGFECWVDDECIVPQAGDFYGGWITSNLRGPFKGEPGTRGW